MFDFNEELKKYQPILELDDIESTLQQSQMQDLLDIVQHLVKERKQSAQN